MTTINDIRDIVNVKVPGVGKGVVDYAIKNLGISMDSSDPADIQKCIQETVKHIQTLYGTEKANAVRSELEKI